MLARRAGAHGGHNAVDELADLRVAQPRLGLPLEFGAGHAHRQHRRQALADVVARQVGVALLYGLGLRRNTCVVSCPEQTRQRCQPRLYNRVEVAVLSPPPGPCMFGGPPAKAGTPSGMARVCSRGGPISGG